MKKTKKHKKSLFKKIILITFLLLVIFSGVLTYSLYNRIFKDNVFLKDHYLYIPTGSSFEDVLEILKKENILIDVSSFEWLAEIKNYKNNVKPGRYKIKKGMNNNEIINILKTGKQEPVKVVIRGFRNYHYLAGSLSKKIEADSTEIVSAFEDELLAQKYGFTLQTFITIVIPNTYEFYWNTSAEQFIERMAKEYKKFWNNQRKEKAQKIGLSQSEVSILASIVQCETNHIDEMPIIAGVYINRLKKGMLLQADPTVIYALNDFSIQRVLTKHLSYDSPYNTYLYPGLPPGPICIPYPHSIDAVLNYDLNNYLYFCARDDFSGYHVFAKTLDEHLKNARKYQQALNKLNIK